jgi:hypothetical protein
MIPQARACIHVHEMLGSAAVAFREAIVHAPSAASLGGIRGSAHAGEQQEVGCWEGRMCMVRAAVVGERRGATIANLKIVIS